jgi:hypothetical protein
MTEEQQKTFAVKTTVSVEIFTTIRAKTKEEAIAKAGDPCNAELHPGFRFQAQSTCFLDSRQNSLVNLH